MFTDVMYDEDSREEYYNSQRQGMKYVLKVSLLFLGLLVLSNICLSHDSFTCIMTQWRPMYNCQLHINPIISDTVCAISKFFKVHNQIEICMVFKIRQ